MEKGTRSSYRSSEGIGAMEAMATGDVNWPDGVKRKYPSLQHSVRHPFVILVGFLAR